jgi:hypothetical protein
MKYSTSLDNKRSVVYLIESAKGMVSVLAQPEDADIKVAVFFGKLVPPNAGAFNKFHIIFCQKADSKNILNSAGQVVSLVKNTNITLIATDDTFNLMSFELFASLQHLNPTIKLLDHLQIAGLKYIKKFSLRSYVRFRKAFLRHPKNFVPIEFSNKILGYKLKMPFSKIEYLREFTPSSLIDINDDINIVILFPLLEDDQSRQFVQYFDQLFSLLCIGVDNTEKVAVKLHPRAGAVEKELLRKTEFLSRCPELSCSVPLELFDLTGKLVINFQSSFACGDGLEVVLLATHFGYSRAHSSNMTGRIDYTLTEVKDLISSKLKSN